MQDSNPGHIRPNSAAFGVKQANKLTENYVFYPLRILFKNKNKKSTTTKFGALKMKKKNLAKATHHRQHLH